MKTPARIGAALLVVAVLSTFASVASADPIYDSTLDLCLHKTSFDTTTLDRLVHYASFVTSKLPLGRGTVMPLDVAHIRDVRVFQRNFKAGLALSFKSDVILRMTINAPGFHRALADCLPESKYPNARKLRDAFIVELAAQQAVGKIAAGATLVAGGHALGLTAGLLRGASARIFNRMLLTSEIVGAGLSVGHVVGDYLANADFEKAFPRAAAAASRGATDEAIGHATTEDFKDLARVVGAGLQASNDDLDAELDEAIRTLDSKLETTVDNGARADLTRKREALTRARQLGHEPKP